MPGDRRTTRLAARTRGDNGVPERDSGSGEAINSKTHNKQDIDSGLIPINYLDEPACDRWMDIIPSPNVGPPSRRCQEVERILITV